MRPTRGSLKKNSSRRCAISRFFPPYIYRGHECDRRPCKRRGNPDAVPRDVWSALAAPCCLFLPDYRKAVIAAWDEAFPASRPSGPIRAPC
jgi:hypothetical protein